MKQKFPRIISSNRVIATHEGRFNLFPTRSYPSGGSLSGDYSDTIYKGINDTVLLTITKENNEELTIRINNVNNIILLKDELTRTIKLVGVRTINIDSSAEIDGTYKISVVL